MGGQPINTQRPGILGAESRVQPSGNNPCAGGSASGAEEKERVQRRERKVENLYSAQSQPSLAADSKSSQEQPAQEKG